MAPPADIEAQQARRAATGQYFHASYAPLTIGKDVPVDKMHDWSVRITDAKGQPVENAVVKVRGLMPQHAHGLSVAPTVTTSAPGLYVVSGLKFHMPGWWVVELTVEAGDARENLDFPLLL